jgi:site-specific recombinase XerC
METRTWRIIGGKSMCYKNDKQRREALLLEDKLVGIPKFIKDYFVYLKSTTTKINNWSAIRQLLEWLINQDIIKNKIENINPNDLDFVTDIDIINYLDGLKLGLYGTKNTLATINTKKNIFSGFWSYLQDKEYVKKNIIGKKVHEKYSTKDKEVTVPSDAEIENFLSNLENIKSEIIAIRDIAIVRLFMGSGIRIEELVGLDLEDLHLDNLDKPYITVMGKGIQDEEEKQDVRINRAAVDAVSTYLKLRNRLDNIDNVHALFLSEQMNGETGKRKRVAQRSIQDFFTEYSNGTIHPHMLRHYVGTKLYTNSNYDIKEVSKQLRHKSVNTSIKSYVKSNDEAGYKALNSF